MVDRSNHRQRGDPNPTVYVTKVIRVIYIADLGRAVQKT